MGHWARAPAQWPITLVLRPLSYVLWPCPMSYGPVLCPVALSSCLVLAYGPWPGPQLLDKSPTTRQIPNYLTNLQLLDNPPTT